MKVNDLLAALDSAMKVTLEGSDGYVEIEPAMGLRFNRNKFIRLSCGVTYAGQTQKIKRDKKLIKFLEKAGAAADGEVKVVSIGSGNLTEEQYEKKLQFDNLGMSGLIEKYLPVADSFSLTCPYGENGISEELANKALKAIKEKMYEMAETEFNGASEEQIKELPPFKEIYADIENQYKNYCRQNSALIEANDGYACFTDVFSGDRKYSSVYELWHAFNAVDFVGTCEYVLEKLKRISTVKPLTEELETEQNKCLKENLIKTEVTFAWHCTVSGELSKVFYFKLNDDTVKWLSKFESDYDLENLEDLAFYKKGKLLFSSCTHERFHDDYSEDIN